MLLVGAITLSGSPSEKARKLRQQSRMTTSRPITRTWSRSTSSVNGCFSELESKARKVLASENVDAKDVSFLRHMDMRYAGQGYELKIEIPNRELESGDVETINASFYREHERAYGYAARSEATEVVVLRLTAIGKIKRPKLRRLGEDSTDAAGEVVKNERPVFFAEVGESVPCKVYDRYRLKRGNRILGPAILEEVDSTVVIHPDYGAETDVYGNVLIKQRQPTPAL